MNKNTTQSNFVTQNLGNLSIFIQSNQSTQKKLPTPPTSNAAYLKLMLARSVSISTQSSSRVVINNTLNHTKSKLNITHQTREVSISKQVKASQSYKQLHALKRQYGSSDGFCGLKWVMDLGKSAK